LRGQQNASAVDALAIARLQVEALYSFCFLLQDPENIQLFMKNGWKKKYIRFLLEREERAHLSYFGDFSESQGPAMLQKLQQLSFVTDEERRTIESEELGRPFGPQPVGSALILGFPTPRKIIEMMDEPSQKRMLTRLYPEYQFLCSFAHGGPEALLFRAVSDCRSPVRDVVSTGGIDDFYQREVLEPPVIYSALSAVQAATEVAAIYPGDMELLVKVSNAWQLLSQFSVLSMPIWEVRAKGILPLINLP